MGVVSIMTFLLGQDLALVPGKGWAVLHIKLTLSFGGCVFVDALVYILVCAHMWRPEDNL